MRPGLPVLVALSALLHALVPVAVLGQSCGAEPGVWVGVEAGRVAYDVADGVAGYEVGGDLGVGTRSVSSRVGYRRIQLDDSDVSPDLVRASVFFALPVQGPWRYCVGLLGGASRFSGPFGDGTVLAGGAGLGMAHAAVVDQVLVVPFIEARGLAARATGSVLGVDTEESGLSLGLEGGATAYIGRAHIRATASVDGFAAGLGVTPYPAWAVRLGLGYRF